MASSSGLNKGCSHDQNVLPPIRSLGPGIYVIKDGTLTFFGLPKHVTDIDDIGDQDSRLQEVIRPPELTSSQHVIDMDDIVEVSGTAKLGEIVSTSDKTATINRNALGRPLPTRPWEQNYVNSSYGGSFFF